MYRAFGFFYKKLGKFNAMEISVMSFLLMSLIGGTLLWVTERNRIVITHEPVLVQTVVTPSSDNSDGVMVRPFNQTHTYLEPVEQRGESFADMVFTAVSALCVTGLTSTDFSQFTILGQIIVILLVQMGGLGIIVFTSLFAFAIARGITEHVDFRKLMADILDTDSHRTERMIKHVLLYTVLFEGVAFLIMGFWLAFVNPEPAGGINPWWWSLFHSVSAFNNAGFGLLNNNLMNFVSDPVINITIGTLIILGGLGYPVLIAFHAGIRKRFIVKDKEQDALQLDIQGAMASKVQMKVAISGTLLLLGVGMLLPMIIDWNNAAVAGLTSSQKILAFWFQSVSTRTAGFNTVDIGLLGLGTLFLYIFLMFVGANPGGTAGGIKIPTMAVLYGYIKDWFMEPNQPVKLHKQEVSRYAVSHAIRLFFFSIIFIAVIVLAVCIAEGKFLITPDPTFNFLKVIFEIFSAFGTVGLSMGYSGGVTSFSGILSDFSKWLIIIVMLFGRLGPLTVLGALPWKRRWANAPLTGDYPKAQKIQIG